jgi:hypothetical protein
MFRSGVNISHQLALPGFQAMPPSFDLSTKSARELELKDAADSDGIVRASPGKTAGEMYPARIALNRYGPGLDVEVILSCHCVSDEMGQSVRAETWRLKWCLMNLDVWAELAEQRFDI